MASATGCSHKFVLLATGALRHVASGLCLQPAYPFSGTPTPAQVASGTALVFDTGCSTQPPAWTRHHLQPSAANGAIVHTASGLCWAVQASGRVVLSSTCADAKLMPDAGEPPLRDWLPGLDAAPLERCMMVGATPACVMPQCLESACCAFSPCHPAAAPLQPIVSFVLDTIAPESTVLKLDCGNRSTLGRVVSASFASSACINRADVSRWAVERRTCMHCCACTAVLADQGWHSLSGAA